MEGMNIRALSKMLADEVPIRDIIKVLRRRRLPVVLLKRVSAEPLDSHRRPVGKRRRQTLPEDRSQNKHQRPNGEAAGTTHKLEKPDLG